MSATKIGTVSIDFNAKTQQLEAEINSINSKLSSVGKTATATSHATVSGMQAASASLRLLEGGMTNNIRAGERFLSMIPGISAALTMAFPVVGAIALIGVLDRVVTKVQEAITHANGLSKALTDGFGKMGSSAQLANDSLALSNQKIRDQIALLQGGHENKLQDELLAARVEADKLGISLQKDAEAVAKLLSENKVGVLDQLMGKDSDKAVAGNATNFESLLTSKSNTYNDAVHASKDPANDPAVKKAKQDLMQVFDNIDGYVKGEITKRTGKTSTPDGGTVDYSKVYGDQTPNLAILNGLKSVSDYSRDSIGLQDEHKSLSGTLDTDEKNAALKAAQDKALAERIKFRDKMTKAYAEMVVKDQEELAKEADLLDKFNPDPFHMADNKKANEGESGIQQAIKLNNEVASIQLKGAASLKEQNLAWEVATGRISKHDAALQQAILHTQQYNAALAELNKQPFSPEQQRSLTQLQAGRQLEVQKDSESNASSTVSGGVRNAMNEFTQSLVDITGKINSLVQNTLNSLNDDIVNGRGFKSTGKDALKSASKAGLQYAEGSVLGLLGLKGTGKPDGSPSKPFSVIFAGGLPGGGSTTGAGAGGLAQTLFGSVFGGHQALGGDVQAGTSYEVGEMGREMFVPTTNGKIIPNKSLGGSPAYYTIDARGANAADVERRVQGALAQVHGSAVMNSQLAAKEDRRRKPSSVR